FVAPVRCGLDERPATAATDDQRPTTNDQRPSMMRAVLISTYEMGRQPFGLASPAAWLRRDGWDVTCVDLAKGQLRRDAGAGAELVGFYLPMHTATRLAGPVIAKVRELNARARLCAFGLYAPLNAEWLRSLGIDEVLAGEFEEELTHVAARAAHGRPPHAPAA